VKSPPHELTLIAYQRSDAGVVIVDIIETSAHYAPGFWSRFRRDPEVHGVAVYPAAGPGRLALEARPIHWKA